MRNKETNQPEGDHEKFHSNLFDDFKASSLTVGCMRSRALLCCGASVLHSLSSHRGYKWQWRFYVLLVAYVSYLFPCSCDLHVAYFGLTF